MIITNAKNTLISIFYKNNVSQAWQTSAMQYVSNNDVQSQNAVSTYLCKGADTVFLALQSRIVVGICVWVVQAAQSILIYVLCFYC